MPASPSAASPPVPRHHRSRRCRGPRAFRPVIRTAGRTAAAGALVLGLGLAPVATAPGAFAAPARHPAAAGNLAPLRWGPCPALPGGGTWAPRTSCATLRVPLDHRAPQGRTIALTISRVPAANPARRRGVLLLNPGGPGGSGLELPSVVVTQKALPAQVLDTYDLIGFDPRGVGHSSPVTCGLTPAQLLVSSTSATSGAGPADVRLARSIADACAARAGAVLPYLTTAGTARDLDLVRQALGEDRISYVGVSYGTYLGAVYASLFPGRVDRMVLDSLVDPGAVWYGVFRQMAQGLTDRFPDAVRYAARHRAQVGFGATETAVRTRFDQVVRALDRAPVRLPGLPAPLDGDMFTMATFSVLYDQQGEPVAGRIWAAAGRLVNHRATAADRNFLGSFVRTVLIGAEGAPGVPADNATAQGLAVLCGDVSWPRDLGFYTRNVAADRQRFPLSRGDFAGVSPCTYWRSQPREAPVAIGADGPRNILLLNNRRDPATPLSRARNLRTALGARAVFVEVDAGGHGVLGDRDRCADAAIAAFLGAGRLPARDAVCPATGR